MANMVFGVLTGRGKDQDFRGDPKARQRADFQATETFKKNHDPLMNIYSVQGNVPNQHMITGSNVMNMTTLHQDKRYNFDNGERGGTLTPS